MPSFLPLSTRLASSSSNSLVALSAWCPVMDLLAVCTHDSTLHVHRLGWQKIIALPLEEEAALRGVDFVEGVCAVSSLAWRPDGKCLAIGLHSGLVALLSIETKALVHVWQHAPEKKDSITALRWSEWPQTGRTSHSREFLRSLAASPSSSSTDAAFDSPPGSDAALEMFAPLAPLDTLAEAFAQLATPVGCVPPIPTSGNAAPNHSAASRSRASGPAAGEMRGVTHDAFDCGRLTLLLVGDAAGAFRARACATLGVLSVDFSSAAANSPQPILSVDVCPSSGLVSVATRCVATHRIRLHSLWVRSLVSHSSELLRVAQEMQQLQLLSEYIAKAIAQATDKWKVSRKSFYNKLIGLSDILSEFSSEATDRGLADPYADTDPASELLEYLCTGIPSFVLQQFVSRYLSAGPLTKTMVTVDTALDEVHAILALGVQPAAQQVAWRLEELRAAAKWPQRYGPTAVGLDESTLARCSERAGSLLLHAASVCRLASSLRGRYAAFGSWMGALVRLVNNEHEASPAPAQDATDLERDAQEIPTYGPHDVDAVTKFVEQDLETDLMEQALGDMPKPGARPSAASSSDSQRVADADSAPIDFLPAGYTPACQSHLTSASLSRTFTSMVASIGEVALQPAACLSKLAQPRPWSWSRESEPQSSTGVNLFDAARLEPARTPATELSPSPLTPFGNLAGTPRCVALRSSPTTHLLAFLWRQDEQQLITVLSFHSASGLAAATHLLPPKHITIAVPNYPDVAASANADAHSQVMSLDFYDDAQLHVLVQYAAAGELSSKMWLVDLAAQEEAWTTLDAEAREIAQAAVATGSDFTSVPSLSALIASQLSSGSTRAWPLVSSSDEEPTITSRSRHFPATLAASVSLNSVRSLAALVISGRGANANPQPTNGGEEADDEDDADMEADSVAIQQRLLLQQAFKPTRRLILLDMDEEDEEEVPEDEAAEVAGDEAGATEEEPEEELLAELDGDVNMSSSSLGAPSRPSSTRSSFGPHGSAASRRSLSFSPLLSLALLAFMACFDSLGVQASWGDNDGRFRHCLNVCSSRCTLLDAAVRSGFDEAGQPFPIDADPFSVLKGSALRPWGPRQQPGEISPSALTWLERRVFGWTCPQNCAYECMHANVALRAERGEAVVKYYGKWPFRRVLGAQEIFSSLFSVANAVPHYYWLFELRREFGTTGLSMLPLWTAYSIVYLNTWLWSAVFHARDFVWTERLDYFCASLGIAFSLCAALIRTLRLDRHGWRGRLAVFLPVSLLLVAHIGYLQLVHFDYGWNMKVSLAVGIVHSLVWLVHCVRHWSSGYQWRMVAVSLGLWLCASLEVFDFPPFFELLDAHSIWHGLTPALGYLFYTWVREDLRFQLKQREEEQHKHI